jgi:hypothetical protein
MKVYELIAVLQNEFSALDEVSMTVVGKGGISIDEIAFVDDNGGPSLVSYEARDKMIQPTKRRAKKKARK